MRLTARWALGRGAAATGVIVATWLGGCHSAPATQDARLAQRVVAVAVAEPSRQGGGGYTGLVGARVQSDLGFRVPGKVIARLVDAGQAVRKGQALMRIDRTDLDFTLAGLKARADQAGADEARYRPLVATGAVSRSSYDQVKAEADAARAQMQVARDQAGYAVLLADADGVVMETLAEPGQVVTAGQVVVRLAHAGPREAVVNLPETVRPALGSPATAQLYGAAAPVAARLRQLSNAADPRTRTFEARYILAGQGAAAPLGATVTVALDDARTTGFLSVPLGAIDDEGRGPGVWVLERSTGKVAYRPVTVHSFGAETAEISAGIAAGTTVVATGGHELHDGETVRATAISAVMR